MVHIPTYYSIALRSMWISSSWWYHICPHCVKNKLVCIALLSAHRHSLMEYNVIVYIAAI